MVVRCHCCSESVATVDEAIEAGWMPDFWIDDVQAGPLCARCAALLTRIGDDGEVELIPGCDRRALLP